MAAGLSGGSGVVDTVGRVAVRVGMSIRTFGAGVLASVVATPVAVFVAPECAAVAAVAAVYSAIAVGITLEATKPSADKCRKLALEYAVWENKPKD